MGFKKRTIYKLVFDNPELEGLFVRVRRGSVQERLEFDLITDWQEQIANFVRFLVEWNVQDDDDVVRPLTVESLMAEEDDVVWAIVQGWVDARRVAAPLELPSTGGTPTSEPPPGQDLELESTMPMASLAS